MQIFLSNIPENIKHIINSVVPFIVVCILFAFVGQFGIGKVIDIRNQISKDEKDLNVLNQKISLLQSFSGTISENSRVSFIALPDINPSLTVMSQIKIASSMFGVLISGNKSNVPVNESNDMSYVDISFQVTGSRSQVFLFLKSLSSVAPIIIIDKIKISEGAGIVRADTTIRSYWSSLPKTLPVLTEPIKDLTTAEKEILNSVTTLTQPVFVSVPAQDSVGKTDPFN
jgi:hypothetical protein